MARSSALYSKMHAAALMMALLVALLMMQPVSGGKISAASSRGPLITAPTATSRRELVDVGAEGLFDIFGFEVGGASLGYVYVLHRLRSMSMETPMFFNMFFAFICFPLPPKMQRALPSTSCASSSTRSSLEWTSLTVRRQSVPDHCQTVALREGVKVQSGAPQEF